MELGGQWKTPDMGAACGTPLEPRNPKSGRGDWIRTSDPLRPRRKNPHNWGQRETAAPRFS